MRESLVAGDDGGGDDESSLSSLSSLPSEPFLLDLKPVPLVEPASAVAAIGAACALVGRRLGPALEGGVEVADTVGEETAPGGSVDGTELSVVLAAAVVSFEMLDGTGVSLVPGSTVVSLVRLELEVLGGTTIAGMFGVAEERMDPEAEVGGEEEADDGTLPTAAWLTASWWCSDEDDETDMDPSLSSKKPSGLPQQSVFSSANPQQNFSDALGTRVPFLWGHRRTCTSLLVKAKSKTVLLVPLVPYE